MRNLGKCAEFALIVTILGIDHGVVFGARWSEISAGLPSAVAGVNGLTFDPVTPTTLYARPSGPLPLSFFRSTDSGGSWQALSVTGVTALAIDPTTSSTIYVGTGHGLLKSTDGGESWGATGLPDSSIATLAIDPETPSTLYAANPISGQMSRSTDGGESWTALNLGQPQQAIPGPLTIVIDPVTPSTLYALVAGGQIRKSTDGGASWNLINMGPFGSLVLDPANPSTIYATGVFGGGVFKSTDGGASWTPNLLPKGVRALALDPWNSSTVYALTEGPSVCSNFVCIVETSEVFKSTDGGKSWTSINSRLPSGWCLVPNPVTPSTIYACSFAGGIFKSTDAGASWKASNAGLTFLDIRVLISDPVDPAIAYMGGDRGLFKSVNRGASWNQLTAFQVAMGALSPGVPPGLFPAGPAGVRSLLVDFTNPNILYAGTARINGCAFSDTLLFKSSDGGANWTDSITPLNSGCEFGDLGGLMAMDPTNPNTLFIREGDVEGYYGLLKSTDGGANWNFTGLGESVNVLATDPTSPATIYAATASGVFKSTDGGTKWSVTALANTDVNLLAINPIHPNILYAETTGSFPEPTGFRGLFKSTDGGGSWVPINEGLTGLVQTRSLAAALVIDPDHPDILYLGTSGNGVYKSSDGGANWAPFNDGLTNLDVRILTLSAGDSKALYAGTSGGVFQVTGELAAN